MMMIAIMGLNNDISSFQMPSATLGSSECNKSRAQWFVRDWIMEKKKETAPAETGGIFFSSTFDLNHRWVTLTPPTIAQMNGAPIMLQTVQGKLSKENWSGWITSKMWSRVVWKIYSERYYLFWKTSIWQCWCIVQTPCFKMYELSQKNNQFPWLCVCLVCQYISFSTIVQGNQFNQPQLFTIINDFRFKVNLRT